MVLAAVLGLPWFWGGVELSAYRSAAALIGLAAGWVLMRRGASGLGFSRGILWLTPAFLLGAWAFAQTLPLPRAWVEHLSPNAARLQAEAFGPAGGDSVSWLRQIEADARALVPEAEGLVAQRSDPLALGPGAPPPPQRFTLSLLPAVTFERACWYAALLLAFLVVQERAANPARAVLYRLMLFASFGVLAVIGLLNFITAPTRLVWLRDAPEGTRPFGPYVNPSHFAGVMELAVPWLLGYGLAGLVDSGDRNRHRTPRVLALVAAGVCAAAAVVAASKMAVTTIALTCVVLITVASARSRGRARVVLLAGMAFAALLMSALAVYGPLRGRIVDFAGLGADGTAPTLRGHAWSAALRLARDYPWAGSGFGALSEVLPAYTPPGETGVWAQLHNDYLELYVAGGLTAVVLASWLVVAFAHRVWRVSRREASRGRWLPTLGMALGLVALAVHESVDFNLQIPANALLSVVIAAMLVSPLVRWERMA
jgi:hypothetical protein